MIGNKPLHIILINNCLIENRELILGTSQLKNSLALTQILKCVGKNVCD